MKDHRIMMPTACSAAMSARCGDGATIAADIQDARRRTLGLLAAWAAARGPDIPVPYSPQLNPPLWEAGHVAWFYDIWLARNRQIDRGLACDPDHERPAGRLAGADGLYNSSKVAHATRWQLPLPDYAATRAYLQESLAETLRLLARAGSADEALYFFRLSLFHEDMHAEAGTYMAQALDVPLPPDLLPWIRPLPAVRPLSFAAGSWRLGYSEPGFAFDNELPAHEVAVPDFCIDSAAVSWSRYLEFVDAGGYGDPRWWCEGGWHWRQQSGIGAPRYLRRTGGGWQQRLHGAWQPLAMDQAAVHLTWYEADAWCRWAGRRLPSEAEWERAAVSDSRFEWGDVWEWTSSRFAPFDGFAAHPYRDYSRFGFEEHRYVLRGASRATAPRMAHPRYRNYFTAERNDIHMGFRSCQA